MQPQPAASEPSTPERTEQLALARQRAKPIRRAALLAAFNGGTAVVLAVGSALVIPWCGLSGVVATLVLALVAFNEFRGRRRLLAFDPSGATLLGWNQLGLLGVIGLYCLWMLYRGLTDAQSLAEQLQAFPELADAFPDLEPLVRVLVILVYGSVLVLSVLFQGLNALYYFSRRARVEAYRRETPAWLQELPPRSKT